MPGAAKPKARSEPVAPTGMEQSGEVFDRATRLAKTLFGAVAAQITLIDAEGVWRSGALRELVEGDAAGVRHAIATGEPLWIEDASKDHRFSHESVVMGPPYLRFFAGAPIKLEDGEIPGVLWVTGLETRPHDAKLGEHLCDLAAFVADEWTRIRAKRGREAARQESDTAQRMVSSIIESAPISLVMTDLALNIVSASPRWVEARQLEGQAVVGRPLMDLVPDARQWIPVYQRVLAGEAVKADRVQLRRSDGVVIWLQAELATWRDAAGEIGGLIITSYDVTEMVEALERTERSEERLKLAMEIAEIHVWELDYRRAELIKVGAEDTFFTEPKTYAELARDI